MLVSCVTLALKQQFRHDFKVLKRKKNDHACFAPYILFNSLFSFSFSHNNSNKSEDRIDIVELLEAIAYLICQDDPISPQSFHKIFSNRGVPASIFRLADTNKDGAVSIDEMMNFIMHISNPRYVPF